MVVKETTKKLAVFFRLFCLVTKENKNWDDRGTL